MYNEETRIVRVLSVLEKCDFLEEVIIVDDFSSDNSLRETSAFKNFHVIRNDKNLGKSMSIYNGILRSKGDILLFLDADLLGLTVQSIKDLTEPVFLGKADMSISLRKNAPSFWKIIGLDYITGERCFKKNVISNELNRLPDLDGFEIEVFLNSIVIEKKLKLAVVNWPNVESPLKRKKFGVHWDFIIMGLNIFSYLSPIQIFKQIYLMKKLIIKNN